VLNVLPLDVSERGHVNVLHKLKKVSVSGILFLLLAVCNWAIAEKHNDYATVACPCDLEFPGDHGAHPGYRTEWWYYTGNLQAKGGRQYGFQLTFFRHGISAPGAEKQWPGKPSAWRTRQVYLAHAAVSDIAGKQHLQSEDVSRQALGLAGVMKTEGKTTVFLKNWSAQIGSVSHVLNVRADDFSFWLNLNPIKPLVLHGRAGYSLKGSTPERASCYYSFTNLKARGNLAIKDKSVDVTGFAWMDHEFSTALLEPEIMGWDWFSLQLSDQTEIMVFLLRREKGGLHPASSGTFINPAGQPRPLKSNEIKVEVLDTWKSRQSNARYPARWRLRVVPLGIDLTIRSNLPDQEMRTLASTGVTYWEGSVSIIGSRGKRTLKGQGYVELTGYAEAFRAPL